MVTSGDEETARTEPRAESLRVGCAVTDERAVRVLGVKTDASAV